MKRLLLIAVLLAACGEGPGPAPSGPTERTVLTPAAGSGSGELDEAAQVMRDRIDGLFPKSDAQVTVEDDHLVVQATADVTKALPDLVRVGSLGLRPVLEASPPPFEPREPQPPSTATPAPGRGPAPEIVTGQAYTTGAYKGLDCSDSRARAANLRDLPEEEVVACSEDGTAKYHLGPAAVVSEDVEDARAGLDRTTGTQPQVNIRFTDDGQERWTAMTRGAVGSSEDQIGILVDGIVLSAPIIMSVITGDVQITGGFSLDEAKVVAELLASGPLPVALRVQLG